MIRVLAGLLTIIIAAAVVVLSLSSSNLPSDAAPLVASPTGIGALGRIEPQSEVLKINAPSTLEPAVIEKLLVEVGDQVNAGQTLAILDSHRRELADVETAKASLLLTEKALTRVLAGAKAGDIAAQEAMVERTQERLSLAEKQLERAERLLKNNAVTQDDLDIRRADVETERRELQHHQSSLTALREVRQVDIDVAEADIRKAKAALQRAEADLEVTEIRSPITGMVLRVHCRKGERIDSDHGLLDLGDTSGMDVVAEVHESDILKVHLNQPAHVIFRNLNHTLSGHVIEIGRIIGRKDVLSNDPVDDTDARVVEVRIRMDEESGRLVSGLSWAKVEVRIDDSLESEVRSRSAEASAREE
ncbi:MAG: efflux RND transporter periplasmic adaptor subunit [Planctomycetia bacterium]